ncbi:hypothetical protein EDB85DRAFT_1892196 [Lactarius pseudohatsudake]|nr:hypothetical protein EDB85DRAFT_1892196 [Lactarius pseudohatsudake]
MPTVAAPAIIATTAVVAVDTVDLAQLPSWSAPCCCGAAAMASWSFDVVTLSPLLLSSPLSWSLSWWSRAPPHRIALVASPFLLVLVLLACRWHRNRTCVGETPAVVASLFDLLRFHACGCQYEYERNNWMPSHASRFPKAWFPNVPALASFVNAQRSILGSIRGPSHFTSRKYMSTTTTSPQRRQLGLPRRSPELHAPTAATGPPGRGQLWRP